MTTKSFAKIIAVLVVSSVVLVLSRHIYLLRFPVLVDYTSEAALEEAIFKANKCDTAAMNYLVKRYWLYGCYNRSCEWAVKSFAAGSKEAEYFLYRDRFFEWMKPAVNEWSTEQRIIWEKAWKYCKNSKTDPFYHLFIEGRCFMSQYQYEPSRAPDMKYIKRAAEAGIPYAAYLLAYKESCWRPFGPTKNGFNAILKAASLGFNGAQTWLAILYIDMKEYPNRWTQAAKLYHLAAVNDNQTNSIRLAECLIKTGNDDYIPIALYWLKEYEEIDDWDSAYAIATIKYWTERGFQIADSDTISYGEPDWTPLTEEPKYTDEWEKTIIRSLNPILREN